MPIKPWNGDPTDSLLAEITPFLMRLGVINNTSQVIKDMITDSYLDMDKVEIFLQPQRIYSFPREWKRPALPEVRTDQQFKFRFAHWNI